MPNPFTPFRSWLACSFAVWLLLCWPTQSRAQLDLKKLATHETNLKVQTQSYTHDHINDTYIYRQATLEWGNIRLEAEEIRFERKLNTVYANGYVHINYGQLIATGDDIEIDLTTRKGVMRNAILFDPSKTTFLSAKELQKVGDYKFYAKKCTITNCDPTNPAWKIYSENIEYVGGNFSSASGATLYIRNIPAFYFPFLIWPTVTSRQSGFLAPQYQIFSSNLDKFNLGYRVRVPYFWALANDHDITLQVDAIQRRGVGTGFEYLYNFNNGSKGEVKFWQIHERDKRDARTESGSLSKEVIDRADLHPERFKMVLNHNQTLSPTRNFIFSGILFSDSQFQREYDRIREPNPNFKQHVSASLTQQFPIGDASISMNRELVYEELAILNRNLIETRVQRVPEFNLHLSDNPFSKPLTTDLAVNAVRFHRDSGFVGERNLVTPKLRYRFHLGEYFNSMFNIGKRYSFYDVNNPTRAVYHQDQTLALDKNSQTNFHYDISLADAEINTTLSRVYNKDEGVFSKFKHMLTPRLQFQFIEDVPQVESLPVVFPTARNPNPEPTDYFDKEDQLPGKQLLILRLDNLLLTKRRLFERTVKLTESSISRLKDSQLSDVFITQLESIIDMEFASESEFIMKLDALFGANVTPSQKELILSQVQKGLLHRGAGRENNPVAEGPSSVLSRLNVIQRINLLRRFNNYTPRGPTILEQETDPGDPLLPLIIEWYLNPGPQFSVDFSLHYHHQFNRVVESNANFKVQVSPKNQASIGFHNNESSYRTPENIFHEKTDTLEFSNTFEASDDLSFGFNGKLNLNVSDVKAFRRRLVEDSFFINFHPNCYTVAIHFKESAERTTTSGGQQKEIVDHAVSLSVSLGQVIPLPELKNSFF